MEILNAIKGLGGRSGICAVVLGLAASVSAAALTTGPVATPPYMVKVFAQVPQGLSQPDSIVLWNDRVIVGFANRVAKDGTDGKSSTIVEFSLDGKVKRTFQVPGHNDGLRVVGDDDLWALQNEDANPNLVVIELRTGQQKLYKFPPTPHKGGYDDLVVKNGRVFITASNPDVSGTGGINVFPALVRASLSGDTVLVEPVLNGNDNATDITSGVTAPLNLLDPDSMTIDPRGNIVLDSQADSELVFIRHPFTAQQEVGLLKLSSSAMGPMSATITVDDTAFAPNPKAFLLVTDVGNATDNGVIYRIDSPSFGFEPGVAYSASDTLGLVGTLNLDNGFITPIVTGFDSARGLLFIAPDGDNDGDDK
jgi:hypothetical protein